MYLSATMFIDFSYVYDPNTEKFFLLEPKTFPIRTQNFYIQRWIGDKQLKKVKRQSESGVWYQKK